MYFLLLVFLLLESKNEPELKLVIERTFALTGLFLSLLVHVAYGFLRIGPKVLIENQPCSHCAQSNENPFYHVLVSIFII